MAIFIICLFRERNNLKNRYGDRVAYDKRFGIK